MKVGSGASRNSVTHPSQSCPNWKSCIESQSNTLKILVKLNTLTPIQLVDPSSPPQLEQEGSRSSGGHSAALQMHPAWSPCVHTPFTPLQSGSEQTV